MIIQRGSSCDEDIMCNIMLTKILCNLEPITCLFIKKKPFKECNTFFHPSKIHLLLKYTQDIVKLLDFFVQNVALNFMSNNFLKQTLENSNSALAAWTKNSLYKKPNRIQNNGKNHKVMNFMSPLYTSKHKLLFFLVI